MNNNSLYVPRAFLESLSVKFDLDPCSQSTRPFDTATVHYCYDQGTDGLKTDWFGNVWCHPPTGGDLQQWIDKVIDHKKGVLLVPNRTEKPWCQKIFKTADGVLFLKEKVLFVTHGGEKAPDLLTGSIMAAYGEDNSNAIEKLNGVFFQLL